MNRLKAYARLFRMLLNKSDRDFIRFLIAARFAERLYPGAVFGDYGRIWLRDSEFMEYFRRFEPSHYTSADRKFLLRSLLNLLDDLPGDTAECGVYLGASSWLICEHTRMLNKTHHLFDSFEGLSAPTAADGTYWKAGDLEVAEDMVRSTLSDYQIELYKGWIPDRFSEVADKDFCFVHIDVDLYQPTRDSLEFFYPRLVPGGIIICDDYGFITCPGAKKAMDEYFSSKPEPVIHLPTGQGIVFKR